MIRLIAEAAAGGEHVAWYEQWREIITSPAHWGGEFVIETVFAVIGVHTLHKVAHTTVRTIVKRTARLGRLVAGKGA